MSRWDGMRTTDEAAERWAKRRNKRYAANNPLFAQAGMLDEVVDLATPEKLHKRLEERRNKFIECDIEMWHRAGEYRAIVARAVTPEELAMYEKKREILPKSPGYDASFWHELCWKLELIPRGEGLDWWHRTSGSD